MNKVGRVLLILIAVACFAVAISYPLRYRMQAESTENNLEQLIALRDAVRRESADANTNTEANPGAVPPEAAPEAASDQDAENPAAEQQEASEKFSEESQNNNSAAEDADAAGLDDASGSSKPDLNTSGSAAEPVSNADANASNEAVASNEGTASNEAAASDVETASNDEVVASEDSGTHPVVAPDVFAALNGVVVSGEAAASNGEAASNGTAALNEAAISNEVAASDSEANGASDPTPSPVPTASPTPAPTVNRWERSGALAYTQKEKVTLDMDKMLPEYREIYNLNNDFIGWITIPGVDVDYPIVQSEDSEYYLHHDFFGESNNNGQIILDTKCDPYTPSYNLVISGHNMRSGKMFGELVSYASESFWKEHKFVYFDSLMERKEYVIFAAFYSADYDVNEEGFRYNADIQYAIDAKQWLKEIEVNRVYDTGIDVGFGDEFLTLTTCNKSRRNDGRFVVVCRRIREGESF